MCLFACLVARLFVLFVWSVCLIDCFMIVCLRGCLVCCGSVFVRMCASLFVRFLPLLRLVVCMFLVVCRCVFSLRWLLARLHVYLLCRPFGRPLPRCRWGGCVCVRVCC